MLIISHLRLEGAVRIKKMKKNYELNTFNFADCVEKVSGLMSTLERGILEATAQKLIYPIRERLHE